MGLLQYLYEGSPSAFIIPVSAIQRFVNIIFAVLGILLVFDYW